MRSAPSSSVGTFRFAHRYPLHGGAVDDAGEARTACSATRSISTANAGVSVSWTSLTSGIRRSTAFSGSAVDSKPCPAAAWSNSSMLGNTSLTWLTLSAATGTRAPRRRSEMVPYAGSCPSGRGWRSCPARPGRRRSPRRVLRRSTAGLRAARRGPGPSAARRASSCCGDSRSASGIQMSMPIARWLISLDVADQFGQQGPRPRPLTERLEARFVDFDDDRGPALDGARLHALESIEPVRLQRAVHARPKPISAVSRPSVSRPMPRIQRDARDPARPPPHRSQLAHNAISIPS